MVCETVTAKVEDDFTMKAKITGLSPNTKYTATVKGRTCTFTTAACENEAFNFVFASCLGGQGYGRTSEGWKIFDEMSKLSPRFFLFTGDTIYADCKIPETAKLMDGSTRTNLPHDVLCETIDQFRDRYRYHFEDPCYARFLSCTPTYVVWDDHEILDDWGGAKMLRLNPDLLKAGVRSFFEYWPVMGSAEESPTGRKLYRSFKHGITEFFILDTRSYRDQHTTYDPNLPPQMNDMLGKEQLEWFISSLERSSALWKVVASSVPLSYPTGWPRPEVDGYDGWTADKSLMVLFEKIKGTGSKNILFITGDVHFPYLVSYDPFSNGTPFCYEFGATPLCSIPLPPSKPDQSLNPTVIWSCGEFVKGPMNFGHLLVQTDGNVKVRFIRDDGHVLFEKVLQANK